MDFLFHTIAKRAIHDRRGKYGVTAEVVFNRAEGGYGYVVKFTLRGTQAVMHTLTVPRLVVDPDKDAAETIAVYMGLVHKQPRIPTKVEIVQYVTEKVAEALKEGKL